MLDTGMLLVSSGKDLEAIRHPVQEREKLEEGAPVGEDDGYHTEVVGSVVYGLVRPSAGTHNKKEVIILKLK